jgi:hypothetical protein
MLDSHIRAMLISPPMLTRLFLTRKLNHFTLQVKRFSMRAVYGLAERQFVDWNRKPECDSATSRSFGEV